MKLVLATLAALAIPAAASAALVTYTDRAEFELALGSVSVDSLDGVAAGYHYQEARTDFTIDSPGMYGCINHGGCGDNSVLGFDDAYIWHYQGQDTLTFNSAVFGVGFDYANPAGYGNASPILQGQTAVADAGFFGVISDVALSVWTMDQTGSYMIFDNVTYSASLAAPVPVPAGLPLLLGGFGILGLMRKGRKAA